MTNRLLGPEHLNKDSVPHHAQNTLIYHSVNEYKLVVANMAQQLQ